MAEDPLGLARLAKVQVPAAETPKPEALFGLAMGVVIVSGLYLARDVLIPITLAVVLSFFLAPIVKLLQHARLPKVAAVIVAVLVALAVILLVGAIIGSQIEALVGNLPQYLSTVNAKIEWGHRIINGLVTQVTNRLGTLHELPAPALGSGGGAVTEPAPIPVIMASSSTSYLETARVILEPILSPLATLAIVLIVTIFILIRQEDLRDRLIRLFGSNDLHRTTHAIDDATRRLTRYFLTQAAINICFGIFVGVGLFFIGLPSPVLWGLLAALLRFVPYVGSITAALLPIALAAAVDPGWSSALWTAGLFIVAEGVTGQFLEPVLYGSSTGLSPTAVIIVAIFWSWIWGPIGLVLSTPLTLCLVVIGRHVRHLEFFDVLLGDRPALTPVETLYQRLLAGDPDEILEQADTLLKGRALSSYYDDIALKALRLVASDISRGVVQAAQLVKIQDAMLALIQDLESHDDVDPVLTKAQAKAAVVEVAGVARPERETSNQPAPEGQVDADSNLPDIWRTERSVLCIPGRGPLDGVAASMLAQLLRKHGLGAQAAPSDEASRSAISRLDTTGVAMVCVAYAEIIGSPPHMRYLLRRVRKRFPLCPILVGFWEADDALLQDLSAQEMTGATEVMSSLHEAVRKCLEEAHKVEQSEPERDHESDHPGEDVTAKVEQPVR
ncbi:MAG TPA: AI-2E family transporter [Roseiarcus sp.]